MDVRDELPVRRVEVETEVHGRDVPPARARREALEREGVVVARGVFGARMEVALVNDGPVTIVLEVERS